MAGERVDELKSRGFADAGLYDPPGVSGTHVMYVLHHADRPSLYAGLPDKPRIDPFVGAWKGLFKPVALAGLVHGGGRILPLGHRGAERGRARGRSQRPQPGTEGRVQKEKADGGPHDPS